MTLLEQVAEFHAAFGIPILGLHQEPRRSRFELRKKLVVEEVDELIVAFCDLHQSSCDDPVRHSELVFSVLKEMADVDYVCLGMCLEMGWRKIGVHQQYAFMDNDVILSHMKATAKHLMFLEHLTNIRSGLYELIKESGFEDRWEEIFHEVHKSNMSKLGLDGKPVLREDGKILKGPLYVEPNFHFLIQEA